MNDKAATMMFKLNQAASTQVQTVLAGTFIVTGGSTGQFSISYNTPPTNNPVKAGEAGISQYICVWEVDDAAAIYSSDPVQVLQITDSASSSSKTIANFTRKLSKTYVVAYCYGRPDYNNNINPMGAILTFAPGSNTGAPVTPSLNAPVIVGSSSVFCSFSTPSGNVPNENKNWFGLAKGYSITNDGKQKWIKTAYCDGSMSNNEATAYLDDVPLTVNQTYTFAFGYCPKTSGPSVGMYYVFTAVPAS
jgi:hypothetical protein